MKVLLTKSYYPTSGHLRRSDYLYRGSTNNVVTDCRVSVTCNAVEINMKKKYKSPHVCCKRLPVDGIKYTEKA